MDILDAKTFKQFKSDCSKGNYYSDKNNKYYIGYDQNFIVELKDLDLNSLECLEIEEKCAFYNKYTCPYKVTGI